MIKTLVAYILTVLGAGCLGFLIGKSLYDGDQDGLESRIENLEKIVQEAEGRKLP